MSQENDFWNILKDDWTGRVFESDHPSRDIHHTITVKEDLGDSVLCDKLYAAVTDGSTAEVLLLKSALRTALKDGAMDRVK